MSESGRSIDWHRPLLYIIAIALMLAAISPMLSQSIMISGTDRISDQEPMTATFANRTQEIESILLRINESLLAKHIQKLQDFGTRYAYRVDKCFQASEYIHSVFQMNGLNTSYDPFKNLGWEMRNVIGEKPGTSTSDAVIIICGHYDSISWVGYADAPGADDNGSGTAAVMAAAEVLSDYEFNHTIRFIAFSGEEQGLKGSRYYANNAKAAGDNITGVINLDMIGYNPDPPDHTVKSRHNTLSENLSNFTDDIAQKYNTTINVQIHKVLDPTTNSDHASFWPEYDAINFIEERYTSNPHYHSTSDTIDKLNLTYCANVTQIAIASIAELAELNTTDIAPPAHTPGFPLPGGFGKAQPAISIEVTDVTPLNLSSLQMWVNGTPITPTLIPIPLGYNLTHTPPTPFIDGQVVNVTLAIDDSLGNGFTYSWEFTVDAIDPMAAPNFAISLQRVETVKRGLAIDRGLAGEGDYRHVFAPSIIHHDGEYKMWYTGSNNTRNHVMYANSTDGLTWVKQGIVLYHGSPGEPDANYAQYPCVINEDGEYKMWFTGYDGATQRIMYANSSDGMAWIKHGAVVDIGPPGSWDSLHVYVPTVVKTDEYEMWYTGVDGTGYRILYANSTDGITWNRHPDPIMVALPHSLYDDVRTLWCTVVHNITGYYMWYTGFNGINYRVLFARSPDGINWERSGLAIDKGTTGEHDSIYSAHPSALLINNEVKLWYSTYDGSWRIHYTNLTSTDNKTDLRIQWTASPSTDVIYYEICRGNNISEVNNWTTYLTWNDTILVENRQGDENTTSYYYRIRAIDKVGNSAESPYIVGKAGVQIDDWGLVSSAFFDGEVQISTALDTIVWDCARCYHTSDPFPWKTNIPGRPSVLNTLNTVNASLGIWAHVNSPDVFATVGRVRNVTLTLHAGWNLVSYPHHEIKIVQDALFGLPWDQVEAFDPGAEYDISSLTATDPMSPGEGYWVHLTADAVWEATNV